VAHFQLIAWYHFGSFIFERNHHMRHKILAAMEHSEATDPTSLSAVKECEDKVKMFIERNSEHGSILNFIILYNGKAIGICGFPPMDAERGEYGFYYQLCRKHWSKGLGYEAANGLLNYIVNNTQAQAVFADAVSINPASLSILSRIGFQKNHIQPGGFNRNSLVLDLVHFKYEIIRTV